MAAAADEPTELQIALEWIGFDEAERNALEPELTDLDSVKGMSYKDMRDLRAGFASWTAAEGRMHFNMTRRLQHLIDWLLDMDRSNTPIDMTAFANAAEFIEQLHESRDRAVVRASDEDTMEARAKEASPGKLTGELAWDKWEALIENMLSILIGVRGVPLLYVIREVETPPDEEEYDTFTARCVARCSLVGPQFEADARKVHQIILSHVIGENAEQWIKSVKKHADGRRDMLELRKHYRGEGNQTRRIGDADRLRDTLHYKGESSMPFVTFLSKCQKMFNLYEQTSEPMTESAKLRFLFEKTANTELRPAVEALKTSLSQDPDAFSFASASNHLTAQIKPKVTARGLSALSTADLPSEIMKNGKIHTGFYKNWGALSPEARKMVIAERERLGTKGGGGKAAKKAGNLQNKIKSLTKAVEQQRSQIASLKRKADDDDSASEDGDSAAGNAFGGRTEKERKKKKG